MDPTLFNQLGSDIHAGFRQCNYDEIAFAQLAKDALESFDLPFHWQPEIFAKFLLTSTVQQDPDNEFSNFPLIVYRCQEFYIELLVWTSGTTAIHQHNFSGAFKVLHGSSIHTSYHFEASEFVNSRLAMGQISRQESEYLTVGDTRAIYPGPDGLVHSLFHLENPSVTLVVRTPGLSAYLPQLTLLPPHFAYDEPAVDSDRRVKMMRKLLSTAREVHGNGFLQLVCDDIPRLDYLSLLVIASGIWSLIPAGEVSARFRERISNVHGPELTAKLVDTMEEIRRVDNLRAARRGASDEHLRFFLALLMNIRNRKGILDTIEGRYPDQDPVRKCARFLQQLCRQKKETASLLARMAAEAGVREYMLGTRLAQHLPPSVNEENTSDYFYDLLTDGSTTAEPAPPATFLHQMPELTALFRE